MRVTGPVAVLVRGGPGADDVFGGFSMSATIGNLMTQLKADEWRAQTGFSPELQSTLDKTLEFRPGMEEGVAAALSEWIRHHQPCLFGRIHAKQMAISYCLICEDALCGDEGKLGNLIQDSRLAWTKAGFAGRSSNFVIAAFSRALAVAVPDDTVKAIAKRVCSLYLQEPIESDRVYLDRLWLEQPGSAQITWEWVAGVNYFSAQGDRRWWQDHRFPSGIAFSVNSVGHMVKAGKLARAMRDVEEVMGTASTDFRPPDVHSLKQSVSIAMRTIHNASNAPSGKATYLVPKESSAPECPVEIPSPLDTFDCSQYKGHYHTDYTIPSEYFRPDVLRPHELRIHDLDFTYLFQDRLDNPDFDRMGEGRRIRLDELAPDLARDGSATKHARGVPIDVRIEDAPRLIKALRS